MRHCQESEDLALAYATLTSIDRDGDGVPRPELDMTSPNPFTLAADNSPHLIPLLRSNTSLASSQDEHGYSLLHAAASYDHLDLLKKLVKEFKVDVNIRDEDGETPLFVVETVEAAQCLLEELKADATAKSAEGMTAEEKIRNEGDNVTIADFLRESRLRKISETEKLSQQSVTDGDHLPPLPPNVKMQLGSLEDEESLGDSAQVDPEFRRRIEELAAREDFQEENGQKQLRELVKDALRGAGDSERDVRQRQENGEPS